MTSPHLDSTHGRQRRAWHDITALELHTRSATTSGMACNDRLRAAQTVEKCRAWHAFISLGRQTWSNDVRRGMPSWPLGSTDGRTASGVACYHHLWPAHTVKRRRAWHAIISFGGTHDRTMSGVACHHRLCAAHTVGRHGVWHNITSLRKHTRSAMSSVA